MTKNITIELTPELATLVEFQLQRRLDTVTDPKVRNQIRKVIEMVKRQK